MEQLALTFGEQTSYKLKNTNWDFNFKPDYLKKTNPNDKFFKLDRSVYKSENKIPERESFIKIK